MTEVEICNLALARLGEYKITSFVQAVPAAEKCSALYAPARDALLELHRWNFARFSKTLTPAWIAITDITSAGGLVKVHKATHGLATGDKVTLDETSTDGTWPITVVDVNYYTLDGSTYVDGTVGRYIQAPPFKYSHRYALPADCVFVRSVNGIPARRENSWWELEGRELFITSATADMVYTKKETDTTKFPQVFIDALALRLAADLAMPVTGSNERRTAALTELLNVAMPAARRNNAIEKNLEIITGREYSPTLRARTGGGYNPYDETCY